MTRIVFPLMIAALIGSATPAIADESYRGGLDAEGRLISVTLTLQPAKYPGDPAGQIRFGEPWACDFQLELSGTRGQTSIYSFKGAGAGACTSLTMGYLQSRPDDGGLQVELFDKKNTSRQKAWLRLVTD